VLCYLQECTNVEAARRLGWPEGTMSRRLAKARELLRRRLGGRGAALTGVTLAAWLAAQAAARATPPAALASGTLRAALGFAAGMAAPTAGVNLAQGMLTMMFWHKCRSLILAVVCCLAVAGGALLYHAGRTGGAPPEDQLCWAPVNPRPQPEPEPPLPEGALARLGSLRMRHGGAIMALAFSPDGKLLGTGGLDSHSHVWQPEEGRDFRKFGGHSNGVHAVAWSPDGTLFASAGDDQTVRIWDVPGNKSVGALKNEKQGLVHAVVFLDDKTVATGSQEGVVRVWDVATAKVIRELAEHTGPVFGLARSPDGKELVSTGADGTLRVWDPAAGKELRKLPSEKLPAMWCVAISPDGKKVAAGGDDGVVFAWDVAANKELPEMDGHTSSVASVAWSPDGKTIASGSNDGSIRLWDAATSTEVRKIVTHCGVVHGLGFSKDGKTIAAGYSGGVIRLWDPATGKEVRPNPGHNGAAYAVAHSEKAGLIATGGTDGAVVVWDAATRKELRRWEAHEMAVNAVAFTPDGKTLVSTGRTEVRLWDPATGQQRAELKGHTNWVMTAAVSPDGKTLATGAWDNTVRLWDLTTDKEKDVIKTRGNVRAVAFSRDGRLLAGGGETRGDGLVIWEAASGKELVRVPEPGGRWTTSVAFSHDGRMLFAGTEEGHVRAWETATGRLRFENPQKLYTGDGGIVAVAVSPDGASLSVGTGGGCSILVWDVARMEEIERFKGHAGWIRQLVYAPDGKTLYSVSDDTTGMAWDATRIRRRAPGDAELGDVQLRQLWQEVNDKDGAKAFAAMRTLTAAPKSSVPFLQARLAVKPPTEEQQKRIARLIKALDADNFDEREAAQQELAKLGKLAEAALVKALDGQPTAEVRVRAGQLLDQLRGPGDKGGIGVATLRALEVLERAGTAEARQALEAMSKQDADPTLAAEAKAALARVTAAPR
jgi:WD40 repeat protein